MVCPEPLQFIFDELPIDFHRVGDFQRLSLLCTLHRGFPEVARDGLWLQGGPLAGVNELRMVDTQEVPLYVSDHNEGAYDLVCELAALPCFAHLADRRGFHTSARSPARGSIGAHLRAHTPDSKGCAFWLQPIRRLVASRARQSWSLEEAFAT